MSDLEAIRRVEKKKVTKALKGSREPLRTTHVLSVFYRNVDRSLDELISEYNVPVACSKGCSYCCSFKVDATAIEIFSIVDFIRENLDKIEISALKERLKDSTGWIAPLTLEQHFVSNIPCGLLNKGRCSVYSVRPALCRKFHSTSVEICKSSFERPTDRSIPNPQNEYVDTSIRLAIDGFKKGLKKTKLDISNYEINGALLYALESDEHKRNFRTGKKAFPVDVKAKVGLLTRRLN